MQSNSFPGSAGKQAAADTRTAASVQFWVTSTVKSLKQAEAAFRNAEKFGMGGKRDQQFLDIAGSALDNAQVNLDLIRMEIGAASKCTCPLIPASASDENCPVHSKTTFRSA